MTGLDRFTSAQASSHAGFDTALQEIRNGRKIGHWIWYIFPQLEGLGTSAMSRTYALRDAAEAADYVRHPELGGRLLTILGEVARQLTMHPDLPLAALMGSDIDARKLVSSLTLFEHVGRQLDRAEGLEGAGAIADAARQVLTTAAGQGYPKCAFTRGRLGAADG